MHRLNTIGICVITVTVALFALYELTAKSPKLIGEPLPGWYETQQVEKHTPWHSVTGILPLDKIIHEGHEALGYYGLASI